MTLEEKFDYLIAYMKKKSPASDVVRNYSGVLGGYDLTYGDLIERFGTSKKLIEEHVMALQEGSR